MQRFEACASGQRRRIQAEVEATRTNYSDADLEDFTHAQFGFSKSLGMFDAYLGYSDTSLDDNPLADGRVLFTLSTTIELF